MSIDPPTDYLDSNPEEWLRCWLVLNPLLVSSAMPIHSVGHLLRNQFVTV